MRLTWRAMACEDRLHIMEHIAQHNPQAALALDERFAEKARQAALDPYLYRAGRVPGTREVVVHPNYVMVFRLVGENVEIVRLLHARQQWP
ncbi:type II toxin-antitoxin system RelE/ParE family toxin [Pseudomonas faucium]|uniref:type II toxin-antitoxin system RelE/ParE family toxin n=1 Tax=Pseudomonas faucium TaxID=2740518 RepID=UPI0015966724|nr:type II toxin-antitoxin system RelE/ParE family toxin [Pseudomonas faucium]